MGTKLSLNGSDWEFKDFVGEDWIWRNSEKPDTKDVRWWRRGTVPGTVLHDLLALGEVPDPYYERNSLLVEWVPQRTWAYRKRFAVPASFRGQRLRLCFDGIDYEAQIFLNGKRLGEHRGMFVPAEFDVTEHIRFDGDNHVAVVIERAPDEQPQVSKTRYVRTHKSRMTYWWDFCPRLIHLGIWDRVYLEAAGDVRVEDAFVRPALTDDFAAADVAVTTTLQSATAATVETDIVLSLAGREVARASSTRAVEPGRSTFAETLRIERPELWWPNGAGAQPLYDAKVTVSARGQDGTMTTSDERTTTFGIRRIEWARNETPDETALPYTLVVNGRRLYMKGWNWVPIDAMYGVERPEKLERLLRLAQRANCNLLRVWGGGLIEKEAFYEACDRLGLLVWQEFIQSSSGIANKPSEDAEFVEMMVREAERFIPRKRNHPSLAIWCGGNELQHDDGRPLDDCEPVLAALKDAVRRLDPDRLWLATSPTGRLFNNTLENIVKDPTGLHDVHGPWEHQGLAEQYQLYNRGTSLLHSEFGVEGMTNAKALFKTIAPEHRLPATRDNPIYFHRGSWWNNEPLVQRSFGGGIDDVETLIRASQLLQAEGLRYAVESNLRRQYQSSGTLPWQFNEPFPNAFCTSALDYYAEPKSAYYAVARAYRSLSVTAAFEAQAWAGRDSFEAEIWAANDKTTSLEKVSLTASLVDGYGNAQASTTTAVSIGANGSTRLASFVSSLTSLRSDWFFLDLTLSDAEGRRLAENRYVFSATADLAPLLAAPPASLRAETAAAAEDADAIAVRVTNAGDVAAIRMRLEDDRELEKRGDVFFEDNDFDLLPGESRTVNVSFSGVPKPERRILLRGWNTEPIRLG
ncbi:sugar-binding domain-containing protein [Paenibacillus sp.]|uniref:glycoside hydrolase family 2 protein n=1 Tax=Paenibacillus sp. TaxID=58172 RepID=UPI002810FEF7|nr:sugar-binding domain-containing protein [Paenibacillus sp.]